MKSGGPHGARVKVFDPVKVGGWMLVEKLLRWSIHPRLRARCLQLLGATIGHRVRIYETMLVQILEGFSHLTVGDDSSIGPGGMIDLTGPVEIGSHTALAPGCILMTHSDPGSRIGSRLCEVYPRTVAGIRIGNHVWIGAHTLILAGVTIGDGTVIGAGSLVAKDIPSGVVAYGRPAIPVRSLAQVTSA
jgi:acetyltransferase-like isoleucine patch superfamily enzyme